MSDHQTHFPQYRSLSYGYGAPIVLFHRGEWVNGRSRARMPHRCRETMSAASISCATGDIRYFDLQMCPCHPVKSSQESISISLAHSKPRRTHTTHFKVKVLLSRILHEVGKMQSCKIQAVVSGLFVRDQSASIQATKRRFSFTNFVNQNLSTFDGPHIQRAMIADEPPDRIFTMILGDVRPEDKSTRVFSVVCLGVEKVRRVAKRDIVLFMGQKDLLKTLLLWRIVATDH